MRPFASRALLAAVVLLAYLPSLRNGFVWDDQYMVVDNPAIRSLTHVADYFTDATTAASIDTFGFYRPLQVVVFALEYQLWGLRAAGYHAVNLLLHMGAVLVLFGLLVRLGIARACAFVAAALFGVHAAPCEAVLWIKGLPDVLVSLLLLLAFGCYAGDGEKRGRGTTAFVLFVVALFAKESAVVFLPIAVAYDVLVRRDVDRGRVGGYAAMLAATVLFMMLRAGALPPADAAESATPWSRMAPITLHAVALYARLIIFPNPLLVDYLGLRAAWTGAGAAIGAVAVAAWLAACVVSLRAGRRLTAFGLAWFAFALGVALAKNFTELVPTTQVLAERFLYLPMCGLAFCIAETFDRFTAARARTVAAGVLVVAAMALGAATFIRALQWKDEVVLYTADLGKDPFSDRILRNLASTHVEAGRYAEARAVLEPWRDRLIPEDLATLGFTQFATGDRDQGRALVESVVKAGSASARPYVYLGAIYGLEGRYVDAEQWLQEALRKRGDAKVRSIAYNNLGIVLRSAGDLEQAEQSFREAAQLYPLYVEPWRNLGALLWNAGEWPEAADVYERLVTLQPGEAEWRESAEEARRQAGRPR